MTEPKTITILSLGAGVQSTALALMAMRGLIEKPVAAVFADTKAEPEAVEGHLKRLREMLDFPVYEVTEGKEGLGGDFLAALRGDAIRASQPPFFVRQPDLTQEEIQQVLAEPMPQPGDRLPDSVLMLPTPKADADLFAVKDDNQLAYDAAVAAWAERRRRALTSDRGGMLWRACTRDYKIVPIRRKVREIMREHGAKHVLQQIGISTDERHRENASGVRFITNVHPLLDLGWSRHDCQTWLWNEFQMIAPKSACRWCPYRSNAGWRKMKQEEPREFELACQFDESMREAQGTHIRGAAIVGQLYVHRSFTPLRTADLNTEEGQHDFGFEQECEGVCGH